MEKPLASPCTHICKMYKDYCIGCGRTAEDLTKWLRYTNEQRQEAIDAGAKRLEDDDGYFS